jgi:hypothetical protein
MPAGSGCFNVLALTFHRSRPPPQAGLPEPCLPPLLRISARLSLADLKLPRERDSILYAPTYGLWF